MTMKKKNNINTMNDRCNQLSLGIVRQSSYVYVYRLERRKSNFLISICIIFYLFGFEFLITKKNKEATNVDKNRFSYKNFVKDKTEIKQNSYGKVSHLINQLKSAR